MTFQSQVFILPGLGNSGEKHWQTIWENRFDFTRINQRDWDTPVCDEWVDTIQETIIKHNSSNVILIGHSLACTTVAYWAKKYNCKIKGALLVAPSDTEADTYPSGTSGFNPIPLIKLPFKSVVVASNDDYYVKAERAELFAKSWGSKFHNIGNAGHINVDAGFGQWNEGLKYLQQLDEQ